MKKLQKAKAFTLAETLITLAIVGVIAVMTVPTLKDHSDEVKYVSAAKKAYSAVSSAAMAIEARHTDMAFWDCGTKTIQWFAEVLNTTPIVGASSWEHLSLSGNLDGFGEGKITPDFMTADGMAWQITSGSGACIIVIDTNGEKQPNITGIDQIAFRVGKSANGVDYGVYPDGTPGHTNDGSWCTYRVIQESKMPWFREIGKAGSCSGY